MSDDKKQDFRKTFPNSFIWFLMAVFLFTLMIQNFIETKFAKVSFSYQLEHLVNLQLIQPEDSRKIALNDNLVTFSGKFRDHQTEEGKNRFKYLDLLYTNHELHSEQDYLTKQLATYRDKIYQSGSWYLLFTGKPIPKGGYVVLQDLYTAPGQDNSIVITSLPQKNVTSLASLSDQLRNLGNNPTENQLQQLGASLDDLIKGFRSPLLGIGNEMMKQNLKNIENSVVEVNKLPDAQAQKVTIYEKAIGQMQSIANELNQQEDNSRLTKLRSVRNYKEAMDEYNRVVAKLDDNQQQLDKARQNVESVIWFFNNKELSTKALEKQDVEEYNHWFINAKEEWDNFATNKGGYFKAPDQPLNTVLEKTFKSEEPAPNYCQLHRHAAASPSGHPCPYILFSPGR